jgi:hypothetical protein
VQLVTQLCKPSTLLTVGVVLLSAACVHPTPFEQPGGTQESMKPAAWVSLVVYTTGLPLSFSLILFTHRKAIFRDQSLREKSLGDSIKTNPDFPVPGPAPPMHVFHAAACRRIAAQPDSN